MRRPVAGLFFWPIFFVSRKFLAGAKNRLVEGGTF
jgi:hypothetical protein